MAEKTDHDMITEMHAVLLGGNGHKGLCQEFEEHKESDQEFRAKEYYKFKNRVITIFFFLLGSGALGLSTAGLVKLLGD